MTFQPVVPQAVLIVIAVAVIVMRLITMRQLMKSSTRWATVWRWSGLTLVALLVLLAAARPGIEPVERQAAAAKQTGTNTNVFLIVDRSLDSGVDDFGDGQSRMSGIRADITALIDRYPQARFAVIAFASRPSLDWPLSDDSWTLEPVIERLYPYDESPDDDSQVNAAAAANVLRYQLIAAGQQYPDSENLVFYFGSGAAGSRAPQGGFDPLPGSVDGGAVLGYGATLNEPGLRRIAEQLGVSYAHREPGQPLTQAVPNAGTAAEPTETPATSPGVVARTELYWVFTALAALLLLFEIYLTVREFRRSRMAHRDVTL
ncbi:vWA domain-containing protein [Mycobacterium sp.]|uniref:vWA domain-containing protein n=1 Tax=Mycobacterium sp. TaxID=1785 RepID=UPI002D8CAA54|nr:VWA domain-containing protein [Mycobacterium sp.]